MRKRKKEKQKKERKEKEFVEERKKKGVSRNGKKKERKGKWKKGGFPCAPTIRVLKLVHVVPYTCGHQKLGVSTNSIRYEIFLLGLL